ncbi:MAG: hypothetical protein EOM67_00015 [Spirochaetia bacterium]|nr:hypothetical protein [Spirochaetia bacterium]
MDVKRLQLWKDRHATMLSNDLIKTIIEDGGGMVRELSNTNKYGGRVNAHPLFYFLGKGSSVAEDANHDLYNNANLLYTLGGNFFCFPNFGPPHSYNNTNLPPHGFTANGLWNVVKYGTDGETGATWLLSTLIGVGDYPYIANKIEMLLPNHPVLYSSVTIENPSDNPIIANAAWHNTTGSPFLESGCIINLAAKEFVTVEKGSEFDSTGRLAMGATFDDLTKAPLRSGGTCDIEQVPGMIGFTDLISGKIPSENKLGWASVINPAQQMVYFTFFPGPSAVEEDEIPLTFNNLWMQYGGRKFTPWALYEGGTDHTFCLGVENSIGYYASGLAESVKQGNLLGSPTTVTIKPHSRRVQRYATAFTDYEQVKMGSGIQSVEQVVEGIVLKRGKYWAFIESDSTFHFLKELEKKVLN